MIDIYFRPLQHPSFNHTPLSRRMEKGGCVPCQEKGARGLGSRCFLPLAGTCVSPPRLMRSEEASRGQVLLTVLAEEIHSEDAKRASEVTEPSQRGTVLSLRDLLRSSLV